MKPIFPFMGLTALCSIPGIAQEKPNFLIIQCDHLTQRVIGAYGETKGCTPAIDQVASQGIIFANAYVGCPLSQPSRAALWSGMMPHQTNIRSNSDEHINPKLPESIPTLGSLFSESGYDAVHFGKTHDMGSLRGFKHKDPVSQPFTDPEFPVNNDSFLDVGTCKDAVAYLSNPPQKPFICIADFQNPHNICGYVGENKGEHTNKPITGSLPELPANFEVEDWNNVPTPVQYICCSHRRMTQAAHWSEENYRHYIAAFQHYTKMVSKQIDSVLKALYSTPAGKNTIVVIMADHGDGMASHRMVTKQISFYEEVTNVPFIFAGPGIKHRKNPVDDILTQPTIDLLPTLCELAGIHTPSEKPGISLAPTLKGEKQPRKHSYAVSEWHSEYEVTVTPGRMIRGPRYKYTHYLECEDEELYDLKKDPGERNNLARNPKYFKVLTEHREMLDDYIKRTKDDYRSLTVDADKRWRSHAPGYTNHEGPGARDIINRK
ncbi:sulfatase family protein [Bacteroides salyersiae]|uniref:sulfatase family protein n=1 Tax=Bacteroides salyersiae TaxID=291644 RepID=UPI001C8C4F99|nr:sulfatase-like hydrolase/transferase [Bacteroides salyersiae]